ncbi:MAG: DEAD/DEAH box helicase family protein [Actinomycetes bacterium]
MKFELKDYQEEAVIKILQGLRVANRNFHDEGLHSAISLSAPTGSGKTVIAAAAIEQVLYGDSEGNQPADPEAVFVWLTDDPSLNQQTRKKILEASEKIQPGQLVIVDEGFDQPEFDRGKVYFLNIQRLAKSSLLVKSAEGGRKFTIWQTISATIENARGHYYLVRDEAHRGAKQRPATQQTIAQRLVSGEGGVIPPSPVVVGISATPKRFEEEMGVATPQRTLYKVPVSVEQVKASGLIKDVLSIHARGEGQFIKDTLIREAVKAFKAVDSSWLAYTEAEGEPPVRPAMVIQIPPEGEDEVAAILDVCKEEWDVLEGDAIAHSLQSHTAEEFGSHTVKYVAPQDIHDHPTVRVVLFKEALTTGWDCPRAEVMLSLRVAKDDTYIAQLIGRMVRSPLARRVESDEALNRVLLYLPQFDSAAVKAVKARLESDEGPPTDVEINSVDAVRNKSLPKKTFELFESLTSYVVPGPVHRSQVKRLHRMASLLVGDELLSDAISNADEMLVSVLEAERKRLEADGTLEAAVTEVETAVVSVLEVDVFGQDLDGGEKDLHVQTDTGDVDRMFRSAAQRFRDGLADHYWGWRVMNEADDPYDAKILVIALSNDLDAVAKVEAEAQDRVAQWLSSYGNEIAALSEDKKAKYAEIRAMAREPERVNPGLPSVITMPKVGDEPSFESHLFADADGLYAPKKLGEWEAHALKLEMDRPGFVAWYRNPIGGQRALTVPVERAEGQFTKMFPDFVFFHKDSKGKLRASIVDPHGHHLGDAGPKLRGLASYAEAHGGEYQRIISVIKASTGEYRMLDLTEETVRKALASVNSQDEIEKVFSDHGASYS